MPSWLVGLIAVVVLLAFALFREGRRTRGIDAWIGAHAFARHQPMPEDLNRVVRGATDILRPGPARIYGAIIDGHIEGRRYVIADFEASPQATKTGVWHTLVMTPVAAGEPPPNIDEGSVPAGLPADARSIRHDGWDLVRWRGLFTPGQLDTFLVTLPRVFPGR